VVSEGGDGVINKLIKLANCLDESGFKKEADRVDALIRKNGIAILAPFAIPGAMLIIAELIALAGLAVTVAWVIRELFIRYYNESSKEGVVDRASDALNKVEQTPESDYPINPEHNKAPTKEDVKVGVKDLAKLLPEISIIFDEKRKEERVYTISCLATSDGIDVDYFYFDSPSIPGLVVDDVCERLTGPGGIPVGYIMPGPILFGRPPKWGEEYDAGGISGVSVRGSPDLEMENIVSWICKNKPWVDAVRVHDQAGPKYCGNKRQFSLLYEEQGVLHGPWKCKDD